MGGTAPDPELHEGHAEYEPGIIEKPFYTEEGLLTGAWTSTNPPGMYYFRQVSNRVWWLGMFDEPGSMGADVFRGTFRGDRISGKVARIPWAHTSGPYVEELSIMVSASDPNLRAVPVRGATYEWTSWRKVGL
jgi:hypothetical protein